MDTTHTFYICDVCFNRILDEEMLVVWIIDDKQHDVCPECVEEYRRMIKQEVEGG